MEKHLQVIGTIISSILNYDQLNDQIGDRRGCHSDSTFAPCDGRVIDRNSKLGQLLLLTGKLNVPDLRGKFIRGLNVIDMLNDPTQPFDNQKYGDPDNNRNVGDYQSDAIIEHTHDYTVGNYYKLADTDTEQTFTGADQNQRLVTKGANLGNPEQKNQFESRPRNIAVYFYIKIN